MISGLFKRLRHGAPREPMVFEPDSPEPTLWAPVSQACTQSQLEEPHYTRWCREIREEPRMHRKQWEFCFILQALETTGMLREGLKALGFGVGKEPIAANLAKRGISVLATDLDMSEAKDKGWVHTDQHAQSKQALNERMICEPEQFDRMVDFRNMDMNAIDPDLYGKFDMVWSACAFEHLGSIAHGLDFVVNSVKCLRPGGVAVHTTEFNCSSDSETLDHSGTVLFRRRDFQLLARKLRSMGYEIELNFNLGDQPLDRYVDVPPYSVNDHLKIQIRKWTVTSFGLIIRKP